MWFVAQTPFYDKCCDGLLFQGGGCRWVGIFGSVVATRSLNSVCILGIGWLMACGPVSDVPFIETSYFTGRPLKIDGILTLLSRAQHITDSSSLQTSFVLFENNV